MQPLPEGDAISDLGRHRHRAEARDVLVPDLPVNAAGLDEADLQPTFAFSEPHEHCSGILCAISSFAEMRATTRGRARLHHLSPLGQRDPLRPRAVRVAGPEATYIPDGHDRRDRCWSGLAKLALAHARPLGIQATISATAAAISSMVAGRLQSSSRRSMAGSSSLMNRSTSSMDSEFKISSTLLLSASN